MNRRRGRMESAIELAPLIDIVFLLLIFFMVSATFIRRSELQIDLPEARGGWPGSGGPVTITVHRDGSYAVNGHPAAAGAALAEALAVASGDGDAPRAVIAADALAPHQAVVGAMDAAGQSGLTRISILTREVPLGHSLPDGAAPGDAQSLESLMPDSGQVGP